MAFEVDQFLQRVTAFENAYTTWTWLWTSPLVVDLAFSSCAVDNQGNIYLYYTPATRTYIWNLAGVLTTLNNFMMILANHNVSILKRYAVGSNQGVSITRFDVYQRGTFLFGRDTVLDNADAFWLRIPVISPDGHYIACPMRGNVVNNGYMMLYRGS